MPSSRARRAPLASLIAVGSLACFPPVARAAEAPNPPPVTQVTLTVDAKGPDVPWVLHVRNDGDAPVHLIADLRLASFEVTPPAPSPAEGVRPHARPATVRSVRCALPRDMVPGPSAQAGRLLAIPPGRSFSDTVDPRLFCFSGRAGAALMAGATVVAHLGFTAGSTPPRARARRPETSPFVVTPLDGLTPAVAPVKELVAEPVVLGEALPSAKPPASPPPLRVTGPAAIDASPDDDIAFPVTVANVSASAVTFLFHPNTVAFDVSGPSGIGATDPSPTARCTAAVTPSTAIRDVFTTLAPRGRTTLALLVDELCPDGLFDRPGLYLVRARLDTSHASGRAIGLRTFDGAAIGTTGTRIRVHRKDRVADLDATDIRPKLDPLPAGIASTAPPEDAPR